MNATIEITNDYSKEIINIENIDNKDHLEYLDQDGAKNIVDILSDGISITRFSLDHNTKACFHLKENSYIEIKTSEGIIKISTKTLAFKKNNDNISLVYITEDETKGYVHIKYTGV